MIAHLLKHISFKADKDPSSGVADRRERAELLKEQPPAFSQGRLVIEIFALLVYSHAGYVPPANTQIYRQMKLHNNFNSDSLTLWVYSGRVIDIIHNNLTNLCIFVSCSWLLNVTVSEIQAQDIGTMHVISLHTGIFYPQKPCPGADAGIRSWAGKTLLYPALLWCSLWLLHQKW
jgi:hypothetical protein